HSPLAAVRRCLLCCQWGALLSTVSVAFLAPSLKNGKEKMKLSVCTKRSKRLKICTCTRPGRKRFPGIRTCTNSGDGGTPPCADQKHAFFQGNPVSRKKPAK